MNKLNKFELEIDLNFLFSDMSSIPQYDMCQRQFMVSVYEQNKNSRKKYNIVIEKFKSRFPDARTPDKSTIYRLIKKWSEQKTVANVNKGRSGRKPSVNTPVNQERVRKQLDFEAALPADISNASTSNRNDLGND